MAHVVPTGEMALCDSVNFESEIEPGQMLWNLRRQGEQAEGIDVSDVIGLRVTLKLKVCTDNHTVH